MLFSLIYIFVEIEYPADYVYAKDRLMLESITNSFSKRLTVYLQLINPPTSELQIIRGFCKRLGMQFHFTKPSLCKKYIEEKMPGLMPMSAVMLGKAALLSTDSNPNEWKEVLAKLQASPYIWVIAAQYDGHLLTAEGVQDVANVCQSKENLQNQLLSLLQNPGHSLVQTLEHPGYQVAALLDQHAKKLEAGPTP